MAKTRVGNGRPRRAPARTGAMISSGVLGAALLFGASGSAWAAGGTAGGGTGTTSGGSATTGSASGVAATAGVTAGPATAGATTVPRPAPASTAPQPSGAGQVASAQFGTGKAITETLDPTSIIADGKSTSTATATVTDAGEPTECPYVTSSGISNTVTFTSTDPAEKIGPVTADPTTPGVYTATITSSTTAGKATITATCTYPLPQVAQSPKTTKVTPAQTIPTATVSAAAVLTQTAGPAAKIGIALSPASIPADGKSTTTATATVTDANGNPVTSDTVTFASSDPGQKLSAVVNHGNGTYSVTVTSSTTPGKATITATDTSVKPNLTTSAELTQTPLPASAITLSLSPATIVADGRSTSTATARVTNALGQGVAGQAVTFTSSDPGEKIGAVVDHGDGTYTVTVTSSTSPGTATITATDTSVTPHLAAGAPLNQTPLVAAASQTLAFTGAPAAQSAEVGAGLIASGLALVGAGRRRRRFAHSRRR